jgi:hypothetical protein
VKSGKVKSDVVWSVGLVSETQEGDLSPAESYRRSRVNLHPEYAVQEVRVQSEQSPKWKRGVGKEGESEVRKREEEMVNMKYKKYMEEEARKTQG